MNAVGLATLVITVLGSLSAMILSFLLIAQLAYRRWLSAVKCFAVLIVINFVTAEAADLGASQWNKAIAARVARESQNSN